MDTPSDEKSERLEGIKLRTKLILLSLIVSLAIWIQTGAVFVHYETVKNWFTPNEGPAERYEFPAFDEQRWRDVLANAAEKYKAEKDKTERTQFSGKKQRFQLVSTKAKAEPGKRSDFWSFRYLNSPPIPDYTSESWVRNPVDAFIFAEFEKRGINPSLEADSWSLARRIWLDLNGVPPTPEQVLKFVNSDNGNKYEETVDELLSKKAFGEHWASFWLDVARYSDSNGYELDELKPYAFPYRDFVIWAMNEDVPFDKFLHWQIAGDLMEPGNPLAVAATGFFTNAPINNFLPQESERYDELADQVSTFGRAMLGLTIGCARCHDHFYDPITHVEYHGLVAILKDTKRDKKYLVPDQGREYLDSGGKEYEAARKEVTQMLMESVKETNISDLSFTNAEKDLLRQPIDPENKEQALLLAKCMRCLMVDEEDVSVDTQPLGKDRKRFNFLQDRIRRLLPNLEPLPPMGLTLSGNTVSKMPILKGGKPDQEGRAVGPGFLSELTTGYPDFDSDHWTQWSDSPRIALANWVTDLEEGAGGLVARVIVNRLWQHHFGNGLVTTPSDFGSLGSTPSHPELLEWLAAELVRNNWSLKHIHRLIVTSSTYRQSTKPSSKNAELDPTNKWLSRQNQIRISAECIRDSVLVDCGTLKEELYGRPVVPEIPAAAIFATQDDPEYVWPVNTSSEEDRRRRSVYLVKKRTIPIPFLSLFDMPDASFSCEKRSNSIVPTQALLIMNSPFLKKNTIELANELLRKNDRKNDVITQAFLRILNRPPTPDEVEACGEFLKEEGKQTLTVTRVIDLCHTLFMTNEFIYRN